VNKDVHKTTSSLSAVLFLVCQHNFRFYGRHVEFWNHFWNKVLHPLIAKTYSGKVTKGFLKIQWVAVHHAKNWPGGNFTPPVTIKGLMKREG